MIQLELVKIEGRCWVRITSGTILWCGDDGMPMCPADRPSSHIGHTHTTEVPRDDDADIEWERKRRNIHAGLPLGWLHRIWTFVLSSLSTLHWTLRIYDSLLYCVLVYYILCQYGGAISSTIWRQAQLIFGFSFAAFLTKANSVYLYIILFI